HSTHTFSLPDALPILVVEVEQVDGAPDGGIEEDAGLAGETLRERGEVGDPAVGDDQVRLRKALDEAREVVGDRRQPAAAVDEDRSEEHTSELQSPDHL